MSDTVFYSTANNHNHRELTIVNVALLVSKPPTKEKRIRIKVRMLLSGSVNMGSPAWLDKAYAYVAENHDTISPKKLEFRGYDLHFSADNLFEQDGVKSPRCQMKSFEIHECGDSEAPDVAVSFVIYAPFSGALWQWLGNFGGETCWCSFTPSVPDATEPPEGDDEDEEGPEDMDDDDAEEIDAESEEEDSDVPDGEETELDPDNETEVVQEDDTVLEDAMHVFEEYGKVSTVELQRVLSISYTRAAHIIDRMQVKGMVTKPDENGVRGLNASGTVPQKSGPKSLAAYHEKVLDGGEVKRGRGRPRKVVVDPLTVDAATAF